ncbi:MAG: hypothetical protein FWG49_03065 [Leptospirales bacterium]|nr:hypothetical protein [Leptospirales bacterium]
MTETVNKITTLINEHISKGFILESDIIHFIKSAYGLSETDEITDFLEKSIDEAIVNMISYPSDNFREEIEEFIPAEGISFNDIKKIEDSVNILSPGSFISFNKKIPLSKEDSLYCQKKFVQRLNLNAALNFISDSNPANDAINLSAVKAILRKKKFTSNSACYDFINKLIFNYTVPENDADKEYLKLIDLSSDLFHGTDKDPFDILSDKKDFYIRALLEYDEFNNLLKSYSMEFIMMKKIHAPLVPVDEAVSMIKLIEKITRIAYRTY